MLDVLEVQDKLKNFSQEQLLREMQMPSGSVPQFLVLSELNRRRTMSQDMEKQKMADQSTVKEEVVASSGMPMAETSMLAQQMAPQTSMTENTGIAAMMPKELPSEEEPMKMSFGGLINSRFGGMAAPLAAREIPPRPGLNINRQVTDMRYRPDTNQSQIARQGYSGGLGGFGSDIMGRVTEKSKGDVDNFLGEVEGMAEDRFDIDLSQQQRQVGMSGKGQLIRRAMPAIPFAMKEGGAIKAQSGMFADIGRAIGNIDNTTGLSNPLTLSPPDTNLFAGAMQPSGVTSFAGVYNFIKTNFPNMSDAEARRQAESIVKTQQQDEIPRLDVTVNKGLPAPDQNLFAGSLGTDPTFDQFKIKQPEAKAPEAATDTGVDLDTTIPEIDSVQDMGSKRPGDPTVFKGPTGAGVGPEATNEDFQLELERLKTFVPRTPIEPSISGLESQYGNVFPVSENPYADDIKRMTDMGVGSGVASMDRGFKAVGDYLMEDKFAGVRQAEKEKKIQDAFTFGRGSPLSGMMADRPQTLGVTADQSSIFERDQKEEAERTKKSLENFTGGEEMDKLVDKMQKDKKKTGSDSAGTLGGFGGASGALSELEAEIDKLRAKREKGRESDKWFALAEVGLGMLASQSPTLAGALGEGGLKGLKSFREGKKEYDKDMLGYLTTKASIQKTRGELGLKSQLYRKQIKALENKSPSTALKLKDVLASRDRLIGEKVDLLKDPKIQMDYDAYIKSGGKEASGLIGDILALDEKIKQSETQLGSAFATVDLNTVN